MSATPDPEHYQAARIRDGETVEQWLARLVEHAKTFAEIQADSTAGRRLVRHAIAGKLTRRKLFVGSFAAGYQHGLLTGMEASKHEIARLEAALEDLEKRYTLREYKCSECDAYTDHEWEGDAWCCCDCGGLRR